MYRIEFKPAAHRQILRLAQRMQRADWERLEQAIQSLADNPRPYGASKLAGADLYRVRVRDFRVVYAIDDAQQLVVVTKVARRTESTYR